jgi:predicted O-methyltransferase YrrM
VLVCESDAWNSIDQYLCRTLRTDDGVLESALAASRAAGLPAIQVSPNQGRLLEIIARASGARSILEIGTLGGYSTIFLARGLARGGQLVTLELEPHHAAVARTNLAKAGLAETVEVVVGPAIQSLPGLVGDPRTPFDLVFIDADKPSTPAYLEWSLKLTRPGGLIIIDNVVRTGAVLDVASIDPAIRGIRRALEMLGSDPRLTATAIQTVGSKGHDGLAFAYIAT